MIKTPELFPTGYHLYPFQLDPIVNTWVQQEAWAEVEKYFERLTKPGGAIFSMLQEFHAFSQIEIMISIRDGSNAWEEDGIWHDDGSRVFAFSLSLTISPETLEGGSLELRMKNDSHSMIIPTPPFGTGILFLTGIHGFEHRTRAVRSGRRIILVGWCLA